MQFLASAAELPPLVPPSMEPGEIADMRSNTERLRDYLNTIPMSEFNGMQPKTLSARLVASGLHIPRTTVSTATSKLGWETVRTSNPNYLGRGATFAYRRRDPREFWNAFSMEELRAWTEDLGDMYTDATLTKSALIDLIIDQQVTRPGCDSTVDMAEFMARRRGHLPPPKRARIDEPPAAAALSAVPPSHLRAAVSPPVQQQHAPILPPMAQPPLRVSPRPTPAVQPPVLTPPLPPAALSSAPAIVMPTPPRGMNEEEFLEFIRMRVEIRKQATKQQQ